NAKRFSPLTSNETINDTQSKVEAPKTVRDVKLLFSHCNKPLKLGNITQSWMPNHFVPLLNL
ncbi:unnamed protein product, partial [Rotaria sp. Silwood2]